MALTKLIIFALLGYVVSAASIPQGYLQVDLSKSPPGCFNAPANTICPLIHHQIPGVDANVALFKLSLLRVNMTLNIAKFFSGSKNCTDAIREYACSNSIMQCTPTSPSLSSPYGIDVQFSVSRTEAACQKVNKSCSPLILDVTAYNCSAIQTDPAKYSQCQGYKADPIIERKCTRSKYMHPVAFTELYPKRFGGLVRMLNRLPVTPYRNAACEQQFMDVYCQILQGPICSTDLTQRMYKKSRQDCENVFDNCLKSPFDTKFKDICKLLPDKTATQVPLPSTSGSSSIGSNTVGSSTVG